MEINLNKFSSLETFGSIKVFISIVFHFRYSIIFFSQS